MQTCVVFVALVLYLLESRVLATCVKAHHVLNCTCNGGNFDISEAMEKIPKASTFLLWNCNSVDKLPFEIFKNITSIHIDRVTGLNLSTELPSSLEKLHLSHVKLNGISKNTFLDISYLHDLHIDNSEIVYIEPKSLSELTFKNVTFHNVKFHKLSNNSLNIHFDDENSKLVLTDCDFRQIDITNTFNVSRATFKAEKTSFSNNILKCDKENIMRNYEWLEKLFEKEMNKDKAFICSYLKNNYCDEDRKEENSILSRLKREALTSNSGLQLEKECKMDRTTSKPPASPEVFPRSGQYSHIVSSMLLWASVAIVAALGV